MKRKIQDISPIAPHGQTRFNKVLRTPCMKFSCLAAILVPALVFAQNTPVPAPANNGFKDGRFDRLEPRDNLWDGVDKDGYLAGFVQDVDAILEGGAVGRLRMPQSVQVADLNGDGLLDLLTVDGYGYTRVYFNRGTKTEPKFTHCEMVPLFFRPAWRTLRIETGLHACLADSEKRGLQNLFLGDYLGRLMLIKNTGNPKVPEWRTPSKLEEVLLPTTKDGHLWANLLAPMVYDWNGDGKLDLLLGEGSYSANSIHLLLNKGTNLAPKFDEDGHEYLAFGEGHEQLVPTVVDWNGDGIPDLLVGDRMGTISLYLSKGPWKKGTQLELQPQPVKFGTQTTIGKGRPGASCVSPTVADLNGDGLFDLVIGESNGRIAVAYNIGTATEPKFGTPVELRGEDVYKSDFAPLQKNSVTDWEIRFGQGEGNFYGSYTCVTPAEDPEAAGAEGQHVLKFGYNPSLNNIIRRAPVIFTPETYLKEAFGNVNFSGDGTPFIGAMGMDYATCRVDSNTAIMRHHIECGFLKPGNFKLSFRVKGRGVKNSRLWFFTGGALMRDAKKDPRSSLNWVYDTITQEEVFTVGANWTVVTKTIKIHFTKEPDLNLPDRWKATGKILYPGLLEIRATVEPEAGVLYVDDIQVTPM